MKNIYLMSLAVAALAAAGCSSMPQIRLDRNPSVSFSDYKTFAFVNPEMEVERRYVTLVDGRMREATRQELERRNYVYSERSPDLVVSLDRALTDETMSVDLFDTRQNVRVWQGVSTGRTARKAQENPDSYMGRAMSDLFVGFPMNSRGGDLKSAWNATLTEFVNGT
jgi:hypothetical protein